MVATAATMEAPKEILRMDYQQPPYWIREVQLTVRIFDGRSEAKLKGELSLFVWQVASRMLLERNTGGSLCLDGEETALEIRI